MQDNSGIVYSNRNEHTRILQQENLKSKRKRVSFSIFTANTFEEIKDLRLEREKEFLNFLQLKNKFNEGINNSFSQKGKFVKNPNEVLNEQINQIDIDNTIKERERFSKSDPVPIEIMRVENIFIQNHSNSIKYIEDTNSIDNSDVNKENYSEYKNPDLYLIHTLNTDINDGHILKENIAFSNTYDYNSLNEEDTKKPEILISPLNPLSPYELTILSKTNHLHEMNEINIKEVEKIQIEKEEPKNDNSAEIENQEKAKEESFKNFLEIIAKIINKNYELNKNPFYSIFFEGLLLKIAHINNDFIENFTFFENQINFYKLRSAYNNFKTILKKKIMFNKYRQYNQIQCEKFIRYRNYKIRNQTFENLKVFSQQRSNWLRLVRRELKQPLIWKCFDSLKLYFNYRKIKSFLVYKKKLKLFEKIKINYRQGKEMIKKSKLLRYIFIAKKFLSKARKNLFIQKNKIFNKILAGEFKRSQLLKKVFSLINSTYQTNKEARRLTKHEYNKKLKNTEYIHLKIYQNEKTKLIQKRNQNDSEKEKDEYVCKKIIRNKIQII